MIVREVIYMQEFQQKKSENYNDVLITVFTPTYNREKTLTRCYESLISQTSHNFIWEVIDDGSTDNTQELINGFIKEKKIRIDYIKKENGGKVSAINLSLDRLKTKLWVCLDSDDYFFDDAISTIEKLYEEIAGNSNICGFFGVRSLVDGKPMQGKSIPLNVKFATQHMIRDKLKIAPEYFQVYKKDVIEKYRYPIYENEKFMYESYVQDQIDQKYEFFIIHKPIMVSYYCEDGLTKHQKHLTKTNPIGYRELKRQRIELNFSLFDKLKSCVAYDTGCILSHRLDLVLNSPAPIMTLLLFPLSLLDYLLRYRNV